MHLTLFINPEHPPGGAIEQRFAEHIEQVQLAAESGYDGIAIGHHLSYGPSVWFPPIETLMRLSAAAPGMEVATCMLILPLFDPLHVAQQAALLDIASGGRLTLGVAPGWQEDEFRILEIEHGRRIGRYLEAVSLLRRLWIEEAVDFTGKHFRAENLSLSLKPVQRPRPPMWFGGSVARAVERAAGLADTALGDSWVASSHLTDEVIIEQSRVFRNALDRLGKSMPVAFPMLRNIVVASDRRTALREVGPYLEASYRIFGQWGLFTKIVGAGKAQLELDELIAGRVILGSPEECAEALIALARATGFSRLIARVQWMGMEQRLVLRTIELLVNEVLPLVRRELV